MDIFVRGTPRSLQATSKASRDAWRQTVMSAARAAIQPEEKLDYVDIRAILVYFHSQFCELDIDNIAKPILDALAGIAFGNDCQVAEIVIRRTPLEGLVISGGHAALTSAIARAQEDGTDLVYVRITDDPVVHKEIPR